MRRDRGRHEAEAHFCKAKHRSIGCDRDIGRRYESRPAAEGVPVHARHDRLRTLRDGAPESGGRGCIPNVLPLAEAGRAPHPVEVRAGAEGLALADENDDADAPIV
jgi:hypothetical protein